MKTRTLRSFILLLSLFAVRFSSFAQSNQPDARLSGTLLDLSGGGVGGVHVIAQLANDASAQVWKATSTTDGEYSLLVPPGAYHVGFTRSPFAVRELDVTLGPGEARKIDLRLELERLSSSVVVTAQAEPLQAQETSAPVTTITHAEIDRRRSVSLPDLLLFSPGIAIGRTGPQGGTASVFINGGNSSYTKVLIDGTPVNQPGNAVDFSNFTLENIDKVEVVRGAESAIYGTDAVAGVIQVFTHHGTTRIPLLNLFGEGGNFSSGRGGAQLSGKSGGFDYSGAASYFSTEGQGPNDRFVNRTLSGSFGWSFSDANQVRLSLRNNTSNAGNPGQTVFTPPNLDAHTDYEFFSENARWDIATGKHWHHQLSGAEFYNRQFTANPEQDFYATDPLAFCPKSPTNPNSVPTLEFCDFTDPGSQFKYNRASLNAQSSYLLPNFAVTAGYQYEVENTFIPFGFGHHRRNNQGGYLDFRYSPHPRASLNFGGRAEANGNFGTRVVPRVGASLALFLGRGVWGETRYRIFYGEGIKEPRFDQSFGTDPCTPGNPSLKPEQSKSWSTGIEQKLADDRVKISADYFSNRFYDIISFQTLPPASGCFFAGNYFNTDLARARGTNIAVETKPVPWLFVAGNYSYNDSVVVKSPNAFDPALVAGNRLIRRPPHSGSLTINAAFRGASVTLAGYFSGERTDTDFLGLGLTRNAGYARFDLATGYNFGRGVSTYVRVQNLFDKQYQDAIGYPALGREVRVGMNYRFSGKN